MPSKLTLTTETAYLALLETIGSAKEQIGPGPLTSHWPMVGAAYDGRLLAVGQAVFGWVSDWATAEAAIPDGRRRILADSQSVFADRTDPMSWIAGHRVPELAVLERPEDSHRGYVHQPRTLVQPDRMGESLPGRTQLDEGQSFGCPARGADHAGGTTVRLDRRGP